VIFAHPGWLAVGFVACLAALLTWLRYDARQRKALEVFVSAHLRLELTRSISASRRRLKRGLFIAAVALLFVALAEPQAGFRWEQLKRRGNDIIFAVDTSRSMLTPDVKPDRLVRAKLAIDDFVGRLDGDAVGLVAFAGSAFLQCPLTLDYGAFHESLAALDTHVIPRGGTDISSAIRAAQSALHSPDSGDGRRGPRGRRAGHGQGGLPAGRIEDLHRRRRFRQWGSDSAARRSGRRVPER
jgi:Ca-activated chloride channel family protein